MDSLLSCDFDLRQISPLTLSFIGDSVYDLMVREYVISLANRPVGQLNKRKVNVVNCKFQAECAEILETQLTEEEMVIYKRGKNANVHSIPKNADRNDYHKATGFEALLGYLYLKKDIARLRELFALLVDNIYENTK
ncbi:MAG: ribonuclease III domain-containing protein [Acutalibacteraceae bacterium]|nr:ribonuclease III domain-containing protein [Acutalibacteraceae bacterium]